MNKTNDPTMSEAVNEAMKAAQSVLAKRGIKDVISEVRFAAPSDDPNDQVGEETTRKCRCLAWEIDEQGFFVCTWWECD